MYERTDFDLITACNTGDQEAANILYQRYVRQVYCFCLYRLGQREMAEDVTAEVFMKVFANLHSYVASKAQFKTWLFRIARNQVISQWRKERKIVCFDEDYIHAVYSVENEERQNLPEVLAAISKLTDSQREIILLRFWDELSFEEIAKVIGKSAPACRMQMARSLRVLRQMLPLTTFITYFTLKSPV